MIKHYPLPDTVVIPGTLHKYNSSQACLEFPFYSFLFIQQGLARGKKFKVLAKKTTCERLAEMLRVTLLGPELEESLEAEINLKIEPKLDKSKIKQMVKEARFLAPQDKNGHAYTLEEMVEFIPFETGDKKVVYPSYESHPEIAIQRTGDDDFTINCDTQFECKIDIKKKQTPVYEIKPTKISKTEKASKSIFTVHCLGSSEGFDPTQPANGFLLYFNGKWILWDCPAYLHKHLEEIGITFEEIDGIFISHVHEDHLDIMETIGNDKKVDIYTSPEIFHCMILKLLTIMDCSYEEALSFYNFKPIYANTPFELHGAMFEVFYSCHAIPALGLRLGVPHKNGTSKLYLSGDTLPKRMIKKLSESDIYSQERLKEVENFLPDNVEYDIIFADTGGGAIHADPEDYATNPNKVVYMHTGKKPKNIPKHHHLLKAGQRFIIHR
ncbi:MAG: hypothetical protein GY866_21825 [Proteobacteria bacterium]|nr:hypothetical protein [Pseudomonadota bacterium]